MTRRRPTLLGALLAVALGSTVACGSFLQHDNDANPLLVRTEAGAVIGQQADGVRNWLGIPYAAPPVGDLRWRAPEPPDDWPGTRTADEFGPPCLQAGQETLNRESMEDCLYLNVHRPVETADDLPVMVWIHGGGLKTGSSALSLEMAKGLVDEGVLLVSVGYRLGRLGYFAHPALEAEAEQNGEDPVANFGLMDQIAALQWVQDNIAEFGGDPDQVTIFGISAGGASVNYLMSSPKADGLFDRAVAQSGLGREHPMKWDDAVAQGEALASSLGAPGADADELRGLNAQAIAKLPALLLRNEIPVVDPVLPQSVADTFAAGEEADVPYIVGATDLEMIPSFFVPLGVDSASLSQTLVKGREAESMAAYGSAEEFSRHFPNDVVFGEPARNLALAHADNAPTYLYRFSIVDQRTKQTYGGALHGADYPFVFGFGAGAPSVANADQLAAETSACWAAFAKGEDPICGGVAWPEIGDGRAAGLHQQRSEGAGPGSVARAARPGRGHRHQPYLE